jgi:nicotinamidase/pyrazinamidase
MTNRLKKGDALLIVDVQIDFFPGGALGVPKGNSVVPIINEWLQAANEANIPIFASRDWHPPNHCSFIVQGGMWPSHCIRNTRGAAFHPDISFPKNLLIINKASDSTQEAYSAFQGKLVATDESLEQALRNKKIRRIWVMGLALDYCVLESALEANQKGFEVHVLLQGTRAISPTTGQRAMDKLRNAGVILEEEARPF